MDVRREIASNPPDLGSDLQPVWEYSIGCCKVIISISALISAERLKLPRAQCAVSQTVTLSGASQPHHRWTQRDDKWDDCERALVPVLV
eukprot:3914772-Amphidinium_carterae.1